MRKHPQLVVNEFPAQLPIHFLELKMDGIWKEGKKKAVIPKTLTQ